MTKSNSASAKKINHVEFQRLKKEPLSVERSCNNFSLSTSPGHMGSLLEMLNDDVKRSFKIYKIMEFRNNYSMERRGFLSSANFRGT